MNKMRSFLETLFLDEEKAREFFSKVLRYVEMKKYRSTYLDQDSMDIFFDTILSFYTGKRKIGSAASPEEAFFGALKSNLSHLKAKSINTQKKMARLIDLAYCVFGSMTDDDGPDDDGSGGGRRVISDFGSGNELNGSGHAIDKSDGFRSQSSLKSPDRHTVFISYAHNDNEKQYYEALKEALCKQSQFLDRVFVGSDSNKMDADVRSQVDDCNGKMTNGKVTKEVVASKKKDSNLKLSRALDMREEQEIVDYTVLLVENEMRKLREFKSGARLSSEEYENAIFKSKLMLLFVKAFDLIHEESDYRDDFTIECARDSESLLHVSGEDFAVADSEERKVKSPSAEMFDILESNRAFKEARKNLASGRSELLGRPPIESSSCCEM